MRKSAVIYRASIAVATLSLALQPTWIIAASDVEHLTSPGVTYSIVNTQATTPGPTPAVVANPTPTVVPPRKKVVVNGRTYDAYLKAAVKKEQEYHYSCEFDAAWVVLKTYGFDVGVARQAEIIGVD